MPTIHILVHGKVQGVFYRATAKEVADKIGVTGWVQNTAKGDVELMATGTSEQLEALVSWCYKGPSRAVVASVDVKPCDDLVFSEFKVKRG